MDKHGGSTFFALKNVAKFFPLWTVTRDRLFHEAGCRLVHWYRAYKNLFPHPGLRAGVIPRLLSFVCRAMAIAQLTHLKISIPASGAPPGLVPADCFPGGVPSQDLRSSRRMSFAEEVTVLGDAPPPACSPVGGSQTMLGSAVAEDDVITTTGSRLLLSRHRRDFRHFHGHMRIGV